jgi:hypothetical protein
MRTPEGYPKHIIAWLEAGAGIEPTTFRLWA